MIKIIRVFIWITWEDTKDKLPIYIGSVKQLNKEITYIK